MKKIKIGDYLIISGVISFVIGVLAGVIGLVVEMVKTGGYAGFTGGIVLSGFVLFTIGLFIDNWYE